MSDVLRTCGACGDLSPLSSVTCEGCGRLLVLTVPDRVAAKFYGGLRDHERLGSEATGAQPDGGQGLLVGGPRRLFTDASHSKKAA